MYRENLKGHLNIPKGDLKEINIDEKKRELRVLEGVSPVQPLSSTEFAAPFDGVIFFFVVFAVLFTLRSLSQAYSRTKKKFVFVLCAVGLVGLYFLKRYLYK